MRSSKNIGNMGEDIAASYLLNNNFTINRRNFYSRYGEIDIIATKNDIIHFIEVKTRKNKDFANALESVTKSKQNKLIKTALVYNPDCMCCFDIIEVYQNGEINFIENAFDAN